MIRINSEIIHWQDKVGTVEVGKFAGLAAVPGNPLKDIKVTESVGFVMKGGLIYRSALSSN